MSGETEGGRSEDETVRTNIDGTCCVGLRECWWSVADRGRSLDGQVQESGL